jgi:hypothetical protein
MRFLACLVRIGPNRPILEASAVTVAVSATCSTAGIERNLNVPYAETRNVTRFRTRHQATPCLDREATETSSWAWSISSELAAMGNSLGRGGINRSFLSASLSRTKCRVTHYQRACGLCHDGCKGVGAYSADCPREHSGRAGIFRLYRVGGSTRRSTRLLGRSLSDRKSSI